MAQTTVKIVHNYIIYHPVLQGGRYFNITNRNLCNADKDRIYQSIGRERLLMINCITSLECQLQHSKFLSDNDSLNINSSCLATGYSCTLHHSPATDARNRTLLNTRIHTNLQTIFHKVL